MILTPKDLAIQLKLYRVKNNLTQYDISLKTGIKQTTISSFENNPDKTRLVTVFKIIQSLDLGVALLSKDEKEVETLDRNLL